MAKDDSSHFEKLYNEMKDDIYTYAYRFFRSSAMAEDTVQDVFLQIWKSRDKLDDQNNIRAYIFRTARNNIFNKLKRAAMTQRHDQQLTSLQELIGNSTEESVNMKELLCLYEEAIDKLSRQKKNIYNMSRKNELSHQEIADQLSLSKNSVKDAIVKSSKFIRQYLQRFVDLTLMLLGLIFPF